MDGPGMSLFNGAGSIHLNTSGQRLEEEEAIEDQKRRNEELQNDLKNRFDDFIDDDDESINDSSNFISMHNVSHSRLSRNNIPPQKGFDNGPPLNLQAELLQSENLNNYKSNEQLVHASHSRANADAGNGAILHHGMSQKDLHNYNGFSEGNRIPVNNSPIYTSPNSGQEHFQNEVLTEHHQHCYQAPITGYDTLRHLLIQTKPDLPDENPRQNEDQLHVFYQMRVQEVKRLSEQLSTCRRDAEAAHDELYSRLAVAEAERERAQLSLQQSQELVANSKHRIAEVEHQMSSLNSKLGIIAARNEELNAEVTATTASLMDTQRRLQAAKMNKESAQSTDALFKAQQERYKEDTNHLEKDLMKVRNKLQEKENENLILESRYRDLERSKEELLIEKGSTINKLAMELEEAQHRLAANESADLKEKISQLIVERNTARMQFKDMAGKLEATATELVDYRTKFIRLQEEQSELEAVLEQLSEGRESDSFVQLRSSKTGRGFSSQADKVALLRNELSKTLAAQKLKKEQIEKLNKTIQQKDQLIETFKDAEVRLKKEIENLKASEQKKISQLKSLQNQFEEHNVSCRPELLDDLKLKCAQQEAELGKTMSELSSLLSKYSSLEEKYEEISSDGNKRNSLDRLTHMEIVKERDKLSYQLKDAQKQIEEFKNLYVEVCGVKDKINKDLNELKSQDIYEDLQMERTRVDELKILLEKEKSKVEELGQHLLEQQVKQFDDHLKNYQQTMEASDTKSKEKNSITARHLEITNQFKEENENLRHLCDDQTVQLNKLLLELEESKKMTLKLNAEVELQGERDRLITDLKEKGKQFEQYIQSQQTKLMNRRDACTSPVPTLIQEQISITNHLSDNDHRKTNVTQQVNVRMEEIIREEVAQHFAKEIKKTEICFRQKLSEVEDQYNSNVTQLGDVLKLKTREVASLQSVILTERAKLQEVLSKLGEHEKMNIQNEKLKEEYKRSLEKYHQRIDNLNTDVENIKNQKQTLVEAALVKEKFANTLKDLERLKDKYRILKKTALKYKEYVIEKDKHVDGELKRIKSNYENSLKKMQERLENCLNNKNEKSGTKLMELESKYSEKMPQIQNSKNQQFS